MLTFFLFYDKYYIYSQNVAEACQNFATLCKYKLYKMIFLFLVDVLVEFKVKCFCKEMAGKSTTRLNFLYFLYCRSADLHRIYSSRNIHRISCIPAYFWNDLIFANLEFKSRNIYLEERPPTWRFFPKMKGGGWKVVSLSLIIFIQDVLEDSTSYLQTLFFDKIGYYIGLIIYIYYITETEKVY